MSYKKVLDLDPRDFEANLNIGNAYIHMADSLSNETKKGWERSKVKATIQGESGTKESKKYLDFT